MGRAFFVSKVHRRYSGRYLFIHSGDIRSLDFIRKMQKLILQLR
jgi:hypothetical protein